MRADHGRALLALVVVLAGTGGVVAIELTTFDDHPVRWSLETTELAHAASELPVGEEAVHRVEARGPNITQVQVRLAWEDDVPPGDTLRLRVEAPNGSVYDAGPGTDGTLQVTVVTHPLPETLTVPAPNQASAQAVLAGFADQVSGVGTWTVTVSLDEAPGQEALPGVETTPDGANRYEVTVHQTTFRAVVGA